MRARTIAPLDLDSYQRAARLILTHHLVTSTFPDRTALPLLRRWATELRDDLLDTLGYRLEVTETTARLFTVLDRLDPGAGTATHTDRPFDRRRYAYLALAVAALGRAGAQISLSELAGHVAADASRIDGVDLATDRATDRDAFVDAVAWLAARGAISLADGDAGRWASDPDSGEALYDIDRSVVAALFRPPLALQHLNSVRGLLANPADGAHVSDGRRSAEATRRVRRALIQRPVVYAEGLDDAEAVQLGLPRTTADLEVLTGLVAERRAEGVALVDTSGRLSDVRFPGTGTVAQVALLLAGEICDVRGAPRGVDGQADRLREPVGDHVRLLPLLPHRRNRGAAQRVAARQIARAAISPQQVAIKQLQVDGGGQVVPQQFDVGAALGALPGGKLQAGPEDLPVAAFVRTLLRPVDVAGFFIDGHADDPVAFA